MTDLEGAFRMRGIGKGQTIKLLVVPEILDRIKTQVFSITFICF